MFAFKGKKKINFKILFKNVFKMENFFQFENFFANKVIIKDLRYFYLKKTASLLLSIKKIIIKKIIRLKKVLSKLVPR